MNKTLSIALMGAVLLTSPLAAQAGHKWKHDQGFYDRARVIDVDPIVRTVRVSTPRRECWEEEVRYPVYTRNHKRDGAALVGGIIGGIVGHKVGDGKSGATIAGTLLGASIADSAAKRSHPDQYYEDVSYETRCSVERDYYTEERIEGYRVTYRYQGQTFTTRTDYDPGKFIKIRVKVAPEWD